MFKVPGWARVPLMTEAVIRGIEIAELNNFPKLTVKQQEVLASLTIKRIDKRIDKINSKKQLNKLINSIEFDKIVYQEMATVYLTVA